MNGNELESLTHDWPGVASSIKWEDDLVLTVAGKMFAVYCLRGPHRERISFKVDPGRFLELTDQPGITPAAYMARAFWISINEPDRFARTKLVEFVRHSYDLVREGLSKKQQAALAAKERPVTSAGEEAGSVAALDAAAPTARAKKTAEPTRKRTPANKAGAARLATKKSPNNSAAKTTKPAKPAAVAKKPASPSKPSTKARG